MTMPTSDNNLLAQLAGVGAHGLGNAALDLLAATEPRHAPVLPPSEGNGKLDNLVDRIRSLSVGTSSAASAGSGPSAAWGTIGRQPPRTGVFIPQEPQSFRAAGLNDSLVESLVLKHLLARGDSTGREVADQLKLPFILVNELLRELKNEQMLAYRAARR